jgi:hypothetical protein
MAYPCQERLRDLGGITGHAVTTWSDAAVCEWFNVEVLAKLDSKLTLGSMTALDVGYQELKKRKSEADQRLGLVSINQLLTQT